MNSTTSIPSEKEPTFMFATAMTGAFIVTGTFSKSVRVVEIKYTCPYDASIQKHFIEAGVILDFI